MLWSGCWRQGQPPEQGEGQVGADPGRTWGLSWAWEEVAVSFSSYVDYVSNILCTYITNIL